MKEERIKAKKIFLAIGALTGWLAILLQLYLIILNRVASVPETIIRFFSFYTILTNILVAVFFTVLLLKLNSLLGRFFSQPHIATAIALYITIVGIVYNVILRFLWQPQGLQWIVDELLHTVIPLFFIFYWLIFARKDGLQLKNIFYWLIYPFVYIIWILIRGAFSGFYPYPFINVTTLGYSKVLLNSLGLFCVFLLGSVLFMATAKIISRKQKANT